MGRIYTVGFQDDIIDTVVHYLLNEDKDDVFDFSSFAIVFPGRRPQFYLRRTLANQMRQAYLPPRIFSIEEFIQYLAKKNFQRKHGRDSFQPISLVDACFLIHKIIQNLGLSYFDWQKQLELEHFFLWARKIFQFLEELNKEFISEKQLLNLQDNAEIGLPLPDNINQLLENISQIHNDFHKFLEKNNLTTEGFNYYKVAQTIDKISLSEFKKIYFVGFFALNACEKIIIKNLLEKEIAILFWQRDKDKWAIFEELEKFFAIRPEQIKKNKIPDGNYPRIQIYEGFDTHSQIKGVRDALSNLKNPESTCIVLPKAEALMPLLYQGLPSDLVDYNISLGYPLKRTPIYALIDMIIQAQEKKRQDGSFYAKDYLKIVMHPYVKNIGDDRLKPDITRILIHKIEEALLGMDNSIGLQKRSFIKLEEIEENPLLFQIVAAIIRDSSIAQVEPADLRNQLKLIHQQVLRAFDNCFTLFDFVKATKAILYFILNKSKVFSDIFSGEIFNRFLAILDSLEQSFFRTEEIRRRSSFFELLKICLSSENVPFTGTPARALQILGLLETRNLKFDNLFILDLNEGTLPKIDKGESLVPEGIFPVLGLLHYHKKEEIIRYHFRRLIGSAKNVSLFYRTCIKNNESRSRFIEEIIWDEEKKQGRLYDSGKIKHIEFQLIPKKEEFSLRKTPQTLRLLKNSIFSPSSLDTYLGCPARFYFRYCLGLKQKEDISEEFEASDIGNFLHELLLDFYSLFLNKDVRLDDSAYKYLFELKEKKLKDFLIHNTGERFLLSKVIDYRLENFFRQESRRKEGIIILYLEQELPLGKERIKLDTEYGPAYLKGKLDRVDERIFNGKKKTVVIDYKTGQYNLPKRNIARQNLIKREDIKKAIGSFQLPLYIYLYSEFKKTSTLNLEASFYSLREIKEEFLFGNNNQEELYKIYLMAAKRISSEILCPEIDFVRDDSDEHYCQWCPFAALCKR